MVESGEKRDKYLLSGGFYNTVDEKGRLSFPAALRKGFSGDSLVITRGVDTCLWAYPRDKWQLFAEKLEAASSMQKEVRRLQRHFLGWATESVIDKAGRLAIPQTLREYAGLVRECTVMGLGQKIEIWNSDKFTCENEGNGEDDISAIAQQFADMF
ncbi:MAG: division/cell wall cluster transcriptional repressor MraZ [Termitinemataceae bacterium]|nr:MAG: division/cell wall cluster transcriptional repressor MraZ [Termitinemataceae bacterium]